MKKSQKRLICVLAAAVVSSAIMAPAAAFADSGISEADVKSLILTAKSTQAFGDFNKAYAGVLKLTDKNPNYYNYLAQLDSIGKVVLTPEVRAEIDAFNDYGKNTDKNLGNFWDTYNSVINSRVLSVADKNYFIADLNAWGKSQVFTPDVVAATDAIMALQISYTSDNAAAAYSVASMVSNQEDRDWCIEQYYETIAAKLVSSALTSKTQGDIAAAEAALEKVKDKKAADDLVNKLKAIPTPALNCTFYFVDPWGVQNDGKTEFVLGAPGNGDTFVYKASEASAEVSVPSVGSSLDNSWLPAANGDMPSIPSGTKVVVAEVDAAGRVVSASVGKAVTITQAEADREAAEAAQAAAARALSAARTNLHNEIVAAQAAHNAATEGSDIGDYPTSSMADLQNTITTANAVYSNSTSTLAQLNTAIATLQNAVTSFENSKITLETVARTSLNSEIAAAQAVQAAHASEVEGSNAGQLIEGSKTILQNDITDASNVYNNTSSTAAQLNTAKAALETAVSNFNNSKVIELNLSDVTMRLNSPVLLNTGYSINDIIAGRTIKYFDVFGIPSSTIYCGSNPAKLEINNGRVGDNYMVEIYIEDSSNNVLATGTFKITVTN